MIKEDAVRSFWNDGAVLVRGAFTGWVDVIAAGIARNMESPGEYASENAVPEGKGALLRRLLQLVPDTRIRTDRPGESGPVNWRPGSCARTRRGSFMTMCWSRNRERPSQRPGTRMRPYYFVGGMQNVSMWIPVDPVREASLRLIAGSHRWDRMVRPVRWADNSDFYESGEDWIPVPEPDADPEDSRILEWSMEPGDAVLFHYRTLHGARGNPGSGRRRVLSLRWVGDDARYVDRPGRTSPPFPGHGMTDGQALREDWFPVIWRGKA